MGLFENLRKPLAEFSDILNAIYNQFNCKKIYRLWLFVVYDQIAMFASDQELTCHETIIYLLCCYNSATIMMLFL